MTSNGFLEDLPCLILRPVKKMDLGCESLMLPLINLGPFVPCFNGVDAAPWCPRSSHFMHSEVSFGSLRTSVHFYSCCSWSLRLTSNLTDYSYSNCLENLAYAAIDSKTRVLAVSHCLLLIMAETLIEDGIEIGSEVVEAIVEASPPGPPAGPISMVLNYPVGPSWPVGWPNGVRPPPTAPEGAITEPPLPS